MMPAELNPLVVGERLRLARTSAGITQAEAASSIKAARTTLVAIEQGNRRVRTDELQKLARLYGTSANALMRTQAVHPDLVPRFRKLKSSSNPELQNASRKLSNLVKAEVELENILGIDHFRNYPPERPILSGDVRIQAENDAAELRQWLGLGSAPVKDMTELLEMELGIRVYVRPLHSSISGLFAFEHDFGACVLLNAKHPQTRRNQTGVHELSHLISARGIPAILEESSAEGSRAERYAHAFGRAFLTPARPVARKFREITAGASRLTRRHVILLAHYFNVSREAMVRRLEELELAQRGSWDWFSSQGGITEEQVGQVLGINAADDRGNQERVSPVSVRLGSLAAEAWRQELLTEEQLSQLLELDRLSLRRVLDACEPVGNEEQYAPILQL